MSKPSLIEITAQSTSNVRAEQALLGALLVNNRSIELIIEFLDPGHFSQKVNGDIYHAIRSLYEQGRQADDVTLSQYFSNNRSLEPVGGIQYLIDLMNSIISVISVKDYGSLIYDLYLRRELIEVGETIVNDARNPDPDNKALNTIEEAEKRLFNLVLSGKNENKEISFQKALGQSIKNAETAFKSDGHIIGVPSGFYDIDKMLGGLHPSDLLIVAGRPSMGKTALATNIAFNAAKANKSVAFFSLEMSSEQLASRILASESNIPSDHIRRGAVKFDDFPKFLEIAEELSNVNLFIDDTPGITITGLRNRARRLKRQHNIDLIIVDYLQLISIGGNPSNNNSRVQEISEITRCLKIIAKELNVPVLVASQLSRAVEQRDDKRPQLSDLRESGTIEQDADIVMFIYREEYYIARKKPDSGSEEHAIWMEKMNQAHKKAEIIIAKQRHGPIGSIPLFFDDKLTKFKNFIK